jgi:hypothetical protein
MVEKKEVVERGGVELAEERRCQHLYADGRRCRNRRWADRELCFQHDPEAAPKRKRQGADVSQLQVLTAKEIHELLARAMEGVRSGRLPVGRAYAVGYLAQLMLGSLKAISKEIEAEESGLGELGALVERLQELREGE